MNEVLLLHCGGIIGRYPNKHEAERGIETELRIGGPAYRREDYEIKPVE
jgi:hypothetical protein